MKSKYETIENLHRRAHKNDKAELLNEVPNLLESWGVKLRADDGVLYQINITKPENGILAVGLRYKKKDGTLTEDIIEFNASKPNEVSKYYKGKYERQRIEYEDTHKRQDISLTPFTSVNTCSLYVGGDNDS